MRILSLYLLALFVISCSSTELSPSNNITHPISSIELYLSRKSLTKTEYEQLKLVGKNLFAECGQIRAGRPFSQSQGLEPLENGDSAEVIVAASALLNTLTQNERRFDEPGDNNALYDPGQLFLTVKSGAERTEIRTSLDSISEPTSRAEKELRRLATVLRGAAGSSLCSNRTFYGLGAG